MRAEASRAPGPTLAAPLAAELRYVTGVTGQTAKKGVVLAASLSGSRLLQELLQQGLQHFPLDFAGVPIPGDPAHFRARFGELLPGFEAARVQSAMRHEIARVLTVAAGQQLGFVDARGEHKLSDYLAEPHAPLPLVRVDLPGPSKLRPAAELGGKLYEASELSALARELREKRYASDAAADALVELGAQSTRADGLSLRGERFVLFGAGAELSPVYTLLEAGAEVLWLDRHRPPVDHLLDPRLGGTLHFPEQELDLLADLGAVRATILEFAGSEPVHLGMYAFAGGGAREARLQLSFNELVRSLPRGVVRSLLYSLFPTSPSPVDPADAACADARRERASRVTRTLMRTGPLQQGHVLAGDTRISCPVVAQQGASFQVAEYLGKRLAAEAFAHFGARLEGGGETLSVSANIAPITATRSLASPLVSASLVGAPALGILIAQPASSRALSSLLTVRDVLAPPSTHALFARQLHGGVHAQPYALDGLIRVAALRGFAQKPLLALELWR